MLNLVMLKLVSDVLEANGNFTLLLKLRDTVCIPKAYSL